LDLAMFEDADAESEVSPTLLGPLYSSSDALFSDLGDDGLRRGLVLRGPREPEKTRPRGCGLRCRDGGMYGPEIITLELISGSASWEDIIFKSNIILS
jgi:hypothetical protein